MKPLWIAISCDVEHDVTKVLTITANQNRKEILKTAKETNDCEVTVIDFNRPFEKVIEEVIAFILDCGVPKKDISKIIRSIRIGINNILDSN